MKNWKHNLKNWNGKLLGKNIAFWIIFIAIMLWAQWMFFEGISFIGPDTGVLQWILFIIVLIIGAGIALVLTPILVNLFSAVLGIGGIKKAKDMSPEVKAMEVKRTLLSIAAVLYCIFAVIIVGAVLISLGFNNKGLTAAVIAGSIAIAIYKFAIAGPRKALGELVKKNSLEALLGEEFQVEKYTESTEMSAQAIIALGVFQGRIDNVACNDLLQAYRTGIKFTRVDLDAVYTEIKETIDYLGNSTTETVAHSVFCGSLLSADHNLQLPEAKVIICTDGTPGLAVGGMEKLDVELYSFNQKLDVFTDKPVEALKLLTPQIIEGLDALAEACNCRLIIMFRGSKFLLFTADGGDQFETNAEMQSVSGGIEKTKQQVKKLAAIVDALHFLK